MTKFEWHPAKSASNERKHGISFEEAKDVFYDVNARLIADPEHSTDEDRFIILGAATGFKLLVVCHCYRSNDEIIRIISARKATKNEIKLYREYLG